MMTFQKMVRIFALGLVLSACNTKSGIEESLIIYDPEKMQLFISMLDEKDVDYRVQDGGQIFYPVEQSDIVKKTFEQVTGKQIPAYVPPSPDVYSKEPTKSQ